MNPWNSFLQTVFQFVKSLFTGVTKKMHRNAAILTMGATLIAVIPFTAVDFQGGGKNAIVAFAETQGGSDEDSLEETEDTALPETDGNVLEDETTADETSSSAENEADIETETETETQTETETETENTEMNDAKEETGISEVEPETGRPGCRLRLRLRWSRRNLCARYLPVTQKAITMCFFGSFRRKPETATSKDVSWWQT